MYVNNTYTHKKGKGIPRTNLHFGLCAFHIAVPIVWNFFSSTLRSSETIDSFRQQLKTIPFGLHLTSDLSSASDSLFILLNNYGAWSYLINYLLTYSLTYIVLCSIYAGCLTLTAKKLDYIATSSLTLVQF